MDLGRSGSGATSNGLASEPGFGTKIGGPLGRWKPCAEVGGGGMRLGGA